MKFIAVIITISFSLNVLGQNNVYYNDYRSYKNIINGIYNQNSTSEEYLNLKLPIIEVDSATLHVNNNLNFIKINKNPMVLFDNHDVEKMGPVGIINNTTQVKVDSTFYKEIYRDFSKQWSISFNVWNKVLINDKAYYTDYDLHDHIIVKDIPQLNQKVLIVGQDTGYDYAYHLGYPEFFFLIFLNQNNQVLYESKILDIHIGNEFGMEEDILNSNWNDETKEFELIFHGGHFKNKTIIKTIWNGREFFIENN